MSDSYKFAAWLVAAAAISGCDSSSVAQRVASDAGSMTDGGRDGGKTCSPFGKPQCASGETCCMAGLDGTCSPIAACTSAFQFQCSGTTNCGPNQICCGTFVDDGKGGTAKTVCAESCAEPLHPICLTSKDCPGGSYCAVLPEGSTSTVLAAAVESFLVCMPGDGGSGAAGAHLPLVLVSDVDLPGGSTRFDYQDVDRALGHLVVSHMNDGSVLFIDLKDGTVLKELTGILVARGVAVASDVGLVFVTSSPSSLVLIDSQTMTETKRVTTGNGPDGVGWDPTDHVVGVSDQSDGALSLLPNSGSGTRQQIKLGSTTGNVVFDASRGWFWITVVGTAPPDQLLAVDPVSAQTKATIDLPGCSGAHGLRIHPNGKSAFVACEGNSMLARVDLDAHTVLGTAPTGAVPDVMSIDPSLGWLYVASEGSDLTVFDITLPDLVLVGHDRPGDASHTVAIDPATHHVFFPLVAGAKGTPVLRIMKPGGI